MKVIITSAKNKIFKLYNKYFGFFLLTIILTWAKTYIAYNLDFSLGVKGFLQEFILLINPLGMTVLVFSLSLFRKNQKQSYITLIIIYILNSLFLYSSILYYREHSDFLTLSMIFGFKSITKDASILSNVFNILSYIKWYDFIYWIDVIILFVIMRKKDSVLISRDKKVLFSKRKGLRVVMISIIILLANLGLSYISRPELLSRTFDRNYIVKYLGINGFVTYDGLKEVKAKIQYKPPTNEDIQDVIDYSQARYAEPNPETFGIAEGRNVFVIHVESIEQFLIDYKLEDEESKQWEVTPFLNDLYHSEDSFAFPNIFTQIGKGRSCDAEMMVETSLFGLPRGIAFIDHVDNTFHSLSGILKDKGDYTCAAFHGNVGSFWNRTDMFDNLGYDYFFDANDFVLTDETTVEYGLKDKLFFKQSLKYLEELEQPFYAKYITLSNHSPFPYDEDYDFPKANTKDSTINNYFASSNYADQALEEFFAYLKESGIYENSIFVLYGDHAAIANRKRKTLAPLIGRDPESWTKFDNLHMKRVPLIIHIPGYENGAEIKTYGGQIDIMPTMLHLFGIDTKPFVLMGQDLLSEDKNETIAFRNGNVISPEYTIISKDIYKTKTGELIDDADTSSYNRANMLSQDAKEQLRISDMILETDLLSYYTPSALE